MNGIIFQTISSRARQSTVNQFKNRVDKHFKGLYGVSMTWSLNPYAALLGVAAGIT